MKHDSFTRQYLETALWSSTDNSDDSGGEPLDRNFSVSDISPETQRQAEEDCKAFQDDNSELLSAAYEREGYDSSNAGHDFWLSRNGHGAGFFDRGNEPFWRELQRAAKVWGEVNLYVSDDGQICS